ncbi:GNAT family N-acetyltransferase [Sediminibacillus massiliensis]|uniref:GNAT family N-acetyltransferase n=1 Tax=Sediminibacillus massiliensis TaxID=1926277 RepID=UPI00098836E6|nr:GNAT family N-acetyltransferase [Sediminibacillus massiliensis]
MPEFSTDRLEIHTLTADMMEAVLIGGERLERSFPFEVPAEWPMEVYKQFFPYKIERFREFPSENEWEGVIVHSKDQVVIGDMGFKGGPNEKGIIDLGYSIIPRYQGKGFATEMGRAMVEWGRMQTGVIDVMATCDPDNIASIRVLEKIGFHATERTKETIYWQF